MKSEGLLRDVRGDSDYGSIIPAWRCGDNSEVLWQMSAKGELWHGSVRELYQIRDFKWIGLAADAPIPYSQPYRIARVRQGSGWLPVSGAWNTIMLRVDFWKYQLWIPVTSVPLLQNRGCLSRRQQAVFNDPMSAVWHFASSRRKIEYFAERGLSGAWHHLLQCSIVLAGYQEQHWQGAGHQWVFGVSIGSMLQLAPVHRWISVEIFSGGARR